MVYLYLVVVDEIILFPQSSVDNSIFKRLIPQKRFDFIKIVFKDVTVTKIQNNSDF